MGTGNPFGKGTLLRGVWNVLTGAKPPVAKASLRKYQSPATNSVSAQVARNQQQHLRQGQPDPALINVKGYMDKFTNPDQQPSTPQLDYNNKKFTYNVGCVRDAYFSKRVSFHEELTPSAKGAIADNPSIVTSSDELWTRAGTNKGMISLFIPTDTSAGTDAVTPSSESKLQPAEWEKYGFQFHYNPTTINMSYAGAPNTDVGLEISGQEKFNLIGGQVTQSTISFDIVLNRVADMKYYGPDGLLKTTTPNLNSLYSPRIPDAAEQKKIFNNGTMYDIEFLLATVVGYRIKTKYRDLTADVGWLSGRPVSINLGKGLRYVGFINRFDVKHSVFNERMVPVFSTISMSFNRIPDYSGL